MSLRYIARCKSCGTATSALLTKDDLYAASMHHGWPQNHPRPTKAWHGASGALVLACRLCGRERPSPR